MSEENIPKTPLELRHLGREVKTALELAIAALAPSNVLDALANSAGFLDAVAELPLDSPAVAALVPALVSRTRAALKAWASWREEHLRKVSA